MEIKQACLVLADISGYTRFLILHTTSILHAEMIITDLLEAVIDKAEYPLTISKLEGDAVFLYAVTDGNQRAAQDVLKQIVSFFEAFQARERALIACNTCGCSACRSIEKLHLKVILHHGEVAIKEVRQFVELGGHHAILIHRLLKNSIPAKEYILMTDAFYNLTGGLDGEQPEARTEHAEGIGDVGVKVYYRPENKELPPQPPPSLALPMPGTEAAILTERMYDYAHRRIAGLEPRRQFSSLPDIKLNWLNRIDYAVAELIPKVMVRLQGLFAKRR
jgi:hypothetical protein